jgi:CheY-like chemotaxis protein
MKFENILVVDPDPASRIIAKHLLRNRFTVTTLSSAREALSFITSVNPDLILINVTLIMSMDCIALLRDIRKMRPEFFFVSVATTSFIDTKRILLLEHSGFDGIIHKPLTQDKLDRFIYTLSMTEKSEV